MTIVFAFRWQNRFGCVREMDIRKCFNRSRHGPTDDLWKFQLNEHFHCKRILEWNNFHWSHFYHFLMVNFVFTAQTSYERSIIHHSSFIIRLFIICWHKIGEESFQNSLNIGNASKVSNAPYRFHVSNVQLLKKIRNTKGDYNQNVPLSPPLLLLLLLLLTCFMDPILSCYDLIVFATFNVADEPYAIHVRLITIIMYFAYGFFSFVFNKISHNIQGVNLAHSFVLQYLSKQMQWFSHFSILNENSARVFKLASIRK